MHCHIEVHQIAGMAVILQEGEVDDMPPTPDGFPTCGNFLPSTGYDVPRKTNSTDVKSMVKAHSKLHAQKQQKVYEQPKEEVLKPVVFSEEIDVIQERRRPFDFWSRDRDQPFRSLNNHINLPQPQPQPERKLHFLIKTECVYIKPDSAVCTNLNILHDVSSPK